MIRVNLCMVNFDTGHLGVWLQLSHVKIEVLWVK